MPGGLFPCIESQGRGEVGPLGLAPWEYYTPLPRGRIWHLKMDSLWHFQPRGRMAVLCEDKGLALPPAPGKTVLSLSPGGLAWVPGLAPYGHHPSPHVCRKAEAAGRGGSHSGGRWPSERLGVGPGGGAVAAFGWSLAGLRTGGRTQSWKAGLGGERVGHQVGEPHPPALVCQRPSPTLPRAPAVCDNEGPFLPSLVRRSVPSLPCLLGFLCPLSLQAAGHVARLGGAELGATSQRLRGPYREAVGGGGAQITVGRLQGQLLWSFLLQLQLQLLRLQVENLKEEEASGYTHCSPCYAPGSPLGHPCLVPTHPRPGIPCIGERLGAQGIGTGSGIC